MIIIGVDFGDARTGLAACDRLEMMAVGKGCIEGGFRRALEGVKTKAEELGAELIVVGNPLNMDGSSGPRSQRCRDFAAELEKATAVKVVLYDERLTTVSAHKFLYAADLNSKKHKSVVDELSAQLILEDYLRYRKNTSGQSGEEDGK